MGIVKSVRKLLGLYKRPSTEQVMQAEYYQKLHEENRAYQENNWLVPEMARLLTCSPKSVVEIGCGNARFLKAVAQHVETATGLDWAVSPMIGALPDNAKVQRADVTKDEIPSADLICSGDVLEHFEPSVVESVVAKLHSRARHNFHVIACYDDGHSHLTVMEPAQWLSLFQKIDPAYKLERAWVRRKQKPNDQVCIICNF
ncbi:class I SAM-dependent methyltransferase [Rhizobium rhizophilum]|nr:class I SAM-dependent methyltransferase [Rhizobium rhizophilum]